MNKEDAIYLFNDMFGDLMFNFKRARVFDFNKRDTLESGITKQIKMEDIKQDISVRVDNGEIFKVIIVPFNPDMIGEVK